MQVKETILITGGTGLVGKELIKLFPDAHLNILTTQKGLLNKPKNNIHYFYWDPNNLEIDTNAFENVTTIIHLAGSNIAGKRWTSSYKNEIINSRIKSAELILNVLRNIKHQVKHFISAGGTGWYTPHPKHLYDENAQSDQHTFLADVCQRWEQAALAFETLNIKVSILRTGMVLAPKGGALEPIKKSLLTPIVPVFGNGQQLVSWITLHDLVQCYKWLVTERKQGIFNAVAQDVISHKIMMHHLAIRKWGKAHIKLQIPKPILQLALGQMAQELLINSIGASNHKLLEEGFIFKFNKFDASTLDYLYSYGT